MLRRGAIIMDIKTIAAMLLTGHLISVFFVLLVIKKQIRLALKKDEQMRKQRRNLLVLSLVILFGNFIPIFIDIFTLSPGLPRNKPTIIGMIYGFSNCFLLISASVGLWVIYRYAEKATRAGQ